MEIYKTNCESGTEQTTLKIKEEIEQNYNLGDIQLYKNEESTDGNVYVIEAKNKKYVAKVYDDSIHTNAMIKIHTSLVNNGLNVPAIVKTNSNESYITLKSGKKCVVYSFLQGEQIGSDTIKLDNKLISLIAKEIRKMHDVTKNENYKDIPQVPFTCGNCDRCSVLHFDLTKSNILFNNGKIEFIDFDDAKYGPSVCDVAIAVALLFFSKKKGANVNGMNQFIDEYYGKNLDLKEKEAKMIKDYAIKWIDFTLSHHQFKPSTTESFEVKRKLITLYV